ncbi:MAG: DNA polymerase A family protein, partial [Candidatus Magasanikbacteria bacterium]
LSGDQNMKNAFHQGKDIHKLTASKIIGTPIKDVEPKQRELAKTLNFGIIYGMGPQAFSQQTNLSKKESKEFIENYFKDFPKVKEWQKKIKNQARSAGFVTNENGRRRKIKGGWKTERAAINMPVQSLGADIIKIAMRKTYNFLQDEELLHRKTNLILSIHDELLLEVADDIVDTIKKEVKKILEKDCYQISVPLKVEVKKGKSWGDLKNI